MSATFVQAAVVLLREGLEAILVVAALAAYLSRSGAQERLKTLWLGAGAAVLASIVAAWVFERFYSGMHNDIFEGVIIFLAAALLFYVSGWLFMKQDPKSWQAYLNRQAGKAAAAGSGYVVASLAFLAVFREGAETALFLHVLANSSGGWTAGLIGGIAAASGALVVVCWVVVKGTRRLPLRAVFIGTSAFLFLMGLKFLGEGLQEFQEQALVAYDMAPGADWLSTLGLNPTWEALALQAIVVVVAIGGLFLTMQAHKTRTPTA